YTNATTNTLTASGLPNGTYTFKCLVTGPCGSPVTSNTVTVNVTGMPYTPVIEIYLNDTICFRDLVDFNINNTGNPLPAFYSMNWMLNGTPVGTPDSFFYSNNTLNNLDSIWLEVTNTTTPSSPECFSMGTTQSNKFKMFVKPSDPPTISVAASANPICNNSSVQFTAVAGGPNGMPHGTPTYKWFVNNAFTGATGPVWTPSPFPYAAGSYNVSCEITCDPTTADSCASPSQVMSVTSPTLWFTVNQCTYLMPTSGSVTYNTCGGQFYDSGGPSANYSNGENGQIVFCPSTPGQYMTVTFSSTGWGIATSTDIISVYSGIGTGTLLNSYTSASGAPNCGSITSQNSANGCLTVAFASDGSNVSTGWQATMSCSPTSSTSPPGTNCSNPYVINGLPISISNQTNACYGNQHSGMAAPCFTSNTAGNDKFYRYDAGGPECITAFLTGTTNSTVSLNIYLGCPGAGGTCVKGWSGSSAGTLGGQTTLPSSGTYYFVVDGAADFNYNLVINTFGASPLNDLPCNAEPLIQTIPHFDDNSCAGGDSGGGIVNFCGTQGNLNTLWYTFTTTAGQNQARVRFVRGVGTIIDEIVQVYSGSCTNGVFTGTQLLGCSDDGSYCSITYDEPYLVVTVAPSTTYYVRVDGWNNNTGSYQIIVDNPGAVQPAYGYDCGNPILISAPVCTYGSPAFIGVGDQCDFPINNSAGFYGERDGVFFLFNTVYSASTPTLTFDIYSDPSVTTDWDFIIWNVSSQYPSNICSYINSGSWNTASGMISSSWVDTWQAPANGHTGCRSTGGSHINGFPFNAPIPLSGNQWWLLYVSNFRFGQFPYGFTLDMRYAPSSTTSAYNATNSSAVVYNASSPPQMIWWTGQAGNVNWSDMANWGGCALPSCANATSATVASYYSPSNPYFPVVNGVGSAAITKDLTIRPTGSVTVNTGQNLDVCGNWLNIGTFNAQSNSTVTGYASGSINYPQYFDGNMSGSNSFNNLTMNKNVGAPSPVTLFNKAQVAGTLTLTKGKIITGFKELYVTNNNPVAIPLVFGIQSYVIGNLRRNINSSGGVYYYPLGLNASLQYAKMDITSATTIPNILGFFNAWNGLPGPAGFVDGICNWDYTTSTPGFLNNGYWTFTASANPTDATYDMTLYNTATNSMGAPPTVGFTVAKAATVAGPWALNGVCDVASSSTVTRRTAMTGFSVFATAQTGTALPITLLNFDAVTKGSGVMTTWVTSSEINNDYFVIERSQDGEHFEAVGTRKGAGNSSTTLHYSMLDVKPFAGVSYYRLRQVDFNGSESKSQLVAVSFLENVLNVFPNPAQTEIQYRFKSAADGIALFEIIDVLGKIYLTEQVNVQKGLNTSDAYDIRYLPAGVYFIQLRPIGNEIIEPMQKRFVKETRQE
ncbi:MAG: T9SS type A sorting domain-containing protein, partial [Bacteroidia bacterium]|nr:T9SS type A sorting domain-containing protein [Bacteroidia bacterium]